VLDSPNNKALVTIMYCGYNILELIPFLVFYFLDHPHDCFRCLGKDPDRIYSGLQLTKCERAERKMFVKYGMRSSQAIAHFEDKL